MSGVTFGQANTFNTNSAGSMNFSAWSRTPVWKDATKCVGNLPKSFTGTLDNPAISEEGRRFLADLLGKLSDSQLHDLFEVSRAKLRLRSPMDPKSGVAVRRRLGGRVQTEAGRNQRSALRLTRARKNLKPEV